MNFHACFLSLASLLLAACSSTTVVKRGEPITVDKQATLLLRNEEKLALRMARAQGDSLIVSESRSGRESRLPLSIVDTLSVRGREIDVVKGGMYGFLAGGGLGAILMIASAPASPMAGLNLLAVLPGAFIGALLGNLNETRYVFASTGDAAFPAADSAAPAPSPVSGE